MTHIAAKPTVYRGMRFRSRLEARWAVFLDSLGIREWVYEPDVDGAPSGYLPDFDIGIDYLEIKPESWILEDERLTKRHYDDLRKWMRFADHTAPKELAVCFGEPGIWEHGRLAEYPRVYLISSGATIEKALWSECGVCGAIRIAPLDGPVCTCPQVYDQLRAAMTAARDHSYEDGALLTGRWVEAPSVP